MRRRAVAFVFLAMLIVTVHAVEQETYRVILKFGSVCCGIDMALHEHISRILSEYERESNVSLDRHMVYWGEEGEFNLCLRLGELSATEQETLTERLRLAIGGNELVKLEENALCKEGW